MNARWAVEIGDEFEPEFDRLPEDVRTEILALALLLERFGPQLGRPRVDTLRGSRHANMKELRFTAAGGEWRVPLPSIRSAGPSCWWREANRVAVRRGFIGS